MTFAVSADAGMASSLRLPRSNGSFPRPYRKGNANLGLALLTACAKGVMLWILG